MLILDTEVYTNYFLAAFRNLESGKVTHIETHDDCPLDRPRLRAAMQSHTTISFNGNGYDLPIITAALAGHSTKSLKALSNRIIGGSEPIWRICRDEELDIPRQWDHIDIIDVAPGVAGLKIYGGRLHCATMQDFPIAHEEEIRPDQRQLLRDYCENDLGVTETLYRKLEPAIALRVSMSKQYGFDMRSKSDAQIAESIISSELTKLTGKAYVKPNIPDGTTFTYLDPKIVSFQTPSLKDLFVRICEHPFALGANGSLKIPEWLSQDLILIGKTHYQMGIGGLHSCESRQCVRAGEGLLIDLDVASYYPSIILQQRLAPKSMGRDFLAVYQSLVTRRLEAKKVGDATTADTYKIAVNASFGKLGSKYSPLYAPDLMLQVTLTGQLCLLMLIERMEAAGVTIVSANTDGIVCHTQRLNEHLLEEIAWEWMLDTSFTLERTDYALLASRDVNNYVAVKPNGSTKGKGIFAQGGLSKNPDRNIVQTAVMQYLSLGVPLSQTIETCTDIRQFVTIRRVQGGAIWCEKQLGKAVRFYSSLSVPSDMCIRYATNSNIVPKSAGCKPLMILPTGFPKDVDRAVYLKEAEQLLAEVGAC